MLIDNISRMKKNKYINNKQLLILYLTFKYSVFKFNLVIYLKFDN